MNLETASYISLLLLSTAACSGRTTGENLGVEGEALSDEDDCDTVSANKATSGLPGDWLSPSSYDVTGCHAAYRLNANAYVGLDLVNDPNLVHVLEYGDTVPATRAECEKLRFGLYIWERLPGGGTDYVGSEWKWGRWSGSCIVPSIQPVEEFGLPNIVEPLRLRVQENYRFAMSARRYTRSLDSSSSFTTKKIRSAVREYDAGS